jgi:eukaryotic-like serine/threonine-protein kinase
MVIARGGYATVYRAMQESVAREVAVKVENRTMDNERDRKRFLREARAAGRMSSHPHVVDLFDAGVTPEGHPYLIMELCEGSYADRMTEGPLSAYEARDVGTKIADALADAHALGVLHRDVKPANILITRFGEPALADFGLAILAETRDASVTLDVLTPAYAPPELFRQHSPSPAVDVYALSATLYALMHGRPPRWQKDRNPSLLTLLELFNHPIPDLPDVPPALLSVLRLGMANELEERPTAEHLRDMLAAVPLVAPPPAPTSPRGGRGGAAIGTASVPVATPRPSSPGTGTPHRAGAGEETVAHPAAASDPDTPPRGWRKWRGPGAGALALALVLGGGLWYAVGAAEPDPSLTPRAKSTSIDVTSASIDVTSASGTVDCLLSSIVSARCPTGPECYGHLSLAAGVAHADAVPCAQAHTWEVFALAPLPAALQGRSLEAVAADAVVRRICNIGNLLTVDLHAVGWQVTVLPPTSREYDAGQRDFRCLAGKGENKLTGATLGHR